MSCTMPFDLPVCLVGVQHRTTGREIHPIGPVHVDIFFRDQHLSSGAIERVGKAVLVEMHEDMALPRRE